MFAKLIPSGLSRRGEKWEPKVTLGVGRNDHVRDEEGRIEDRDLQEGEIDWQQRPSSFAGNYVISRHKAGNGGDIDRLLREWRAISEAEEWGGDRRSVSSKS